MTLSPLTVLDYIRSTVEIIISMHSENQPVQNLSSQKTEDLAETYENLLQKMEAEVRTHIRVQQQLKIHAETIKLKLDEVEQENVNLKAEIKNLNDKISDEVTKNTNLKEIIGQMKTQINVKSNKIVELSNKISSNGNIQRESKEKIKNKLSDRQQKLTELIKLPQLSTRKSQENTLSINNNNNRFNTIIPIGKSQKIDLNNSYSSQNPHINNSQTIPVSNEVEYEKQVYAKRREQARSFILHKIVFLFGLLR